MRYTPEQERAFEGNPYKLGEAEERLYGIIVPENKKRAINPDDFADLYDPGSIEADKGQVSELEAKFRSEEINDSTLLAKRRRGELFEAIVNNCIESANWLGQKTKIIIPSRFDDIINGVDSIAEFEERGGKRYFALAVDITKSEIELGNKFASIKKSIDDGRLSRIKYFRSGRFRGELSSVPRVVIGADNKTVAEINDLLLRLKLTHREIEQKRAEGKRPLRAVVSGNGEARRKIEHHPLRFKILLEIRTQLESFRYYAAKTNKPAVKESYENILAIISRVIDDWEVHEEWSNVETDEKATEEDEVCRMILEKAEEFGK